MSADYSNIQTQPQRRNGLAITSLVLGIISIPTLGLLVVGAITAIALGVIALNRIKKEPATYGGKGMAIAGIITSVVSLLLVAVFVVVAAIVTPKMLDTLKSGRETASLNSLRTIHNNEAAFNAMNARFATLKELVEAQLLDPNYAEGISVGGYVYSSSSVSKDTYCVHAVRTGDSVARRDFVICEDMTIRYVESKTPSLVKRGEGVELDSSQIPLLPLNRSRKHWYGTGSGSDRAPPNRLLHKAPGRYRSRYCTAVCPNVACFDLDQAGRDFR